MGSARIDLAQCRLAQALPNPILGPERSMEAVGKTASVVTTWILLSVRC
jgi:hypothetical protein